MMAFGAFIADVACAETGSFVQIGEPDMGQIMPINPVDDGRRVEPTDDVVTPHIPLARPLPQGPVRVLAIANQNYGRWPLEIKQRLDVDLTVVYARTSKQLEYHSGSVGMRGEDVAARLLQALSCKPEVIVSEVEFDVFPDAVQKRIRDLISSGTGYVGYLEGVKPEGYSRRLDAQRRIFASSVPFSILRQLSAEYDSPQEAAENVFELYENALRDRLAAVWGYPRDDGAPDPSWLLYDWQPRLDEEAWNSLLARTIIWCAGRPDGGLTIEIPEPVVKRSDLPLSLQANVKQPSEGSWLEFVIFDRDVREQYRTQMTVEGQKVSLELPKLPAGDHFVLLRLAQCKAVCDWSLQALRISADIEIAEIDVKNRVVEHNAQAEASIRLSAAPKEGSTLLVETLDNFSRVVYRRTVPAEQTVKVSMPTAGSHHIYNYINAKLYDAGGELVDETRASFIVRQPNLPADDLSVRMWMTGWDGGRNWHRSWKHAQDGVDSCMSDPERAAPYNMHAWVPLADSRGFRMISPNESSLYGRVVSIEGVKAAAEKWRQYPVFQYHLGDDFKFDEDWTPVVVDYLVEWAKRRYQDIDRLNEAWSTDYQDFSEIGPMLLADAVILGHADNPDFGGMCHWIDQQLAREEMLIDFLGRLKDAIREVDPHTPLAINNTIRYPGPNVGFNFWELGKVFDQVGAYANPITHDIYRSARAEGGHHGVYSGCYGVYQYPPYYAMEQLPWWSVFQNMNVQAYWIATPEIPPYSGLLAPDLRPALGYSKSLEGVKELKKGIAKMLFNAQRQNDGVAVIFSQGSLNASGLMIPLSDVDEVSEAGREAIGDVKLSSLIQPLPKPKEWNHVSSGGDYYVYMNTWEGFTSLLKDIGFSYDVIPDDDLGQGVLARKGIRLLVLPLSLRLDARAAQAIRQFVHEGGIVMTDLAPGLFGERMHPGKEGMLDDVFGVKSGGGLPHIVLDQGVLDHRALNRLGADTSVSTERISSLGTYMSRTDIRLQDAEALAFSSKGTPLLIINEYGRGKAILFNMLARDYQIWRTLSREAPFRQSIAAVLSWAGMNPRVKCSVHASGDTGMRALSATQKVRLLDSKVEYVGILRDFALRPDERITMSDMRAHPTAIDFGREAHVYDVRRKLYRGYRRNIDELIHPAGAKLYALLPYEVTGFETETAYLPGQRRLNLKAWLTTAGKERLGRHVFRIELVGPDGRPQPAYDENCLAEGGKLQKTIFLGYNASSGVWQLKMSDIASGTNTVVQFTVHNQ